VKEAIGKILEDIREKMEDVAYGPVPGIIGGEETIGEMIRDIEKILDYYLLDFNGGEKKGY